MGGFNFEDDSTESEDLGLDDSPSPIQTKKQTNPQAIVDNLFRPVEPEPGVENPDTEFDDQMTAVEKRLDVAKYYRLLLDNSLFSDDSEQAQQVDKEVRGFIRERLKILMGVQPDKTLAPPEETFTPLEVTILKQIAGLAAKRTTPATPTFTPVSPKSVEPVVAKPPPALKPVATLVNKPQKVIVASQKQQAQMAPKSKPGTMDPATDPRIPENYRKDPTLVAKNGRWWVQSRNADEEPLWTQQPQSKKLEPLLKDVTMAAKPVGVQVLQQPTAEGFSMLMQQQGDAMISAKERQLSKKNASGLFGATLVGNIVPGGQLSGDDE